MIQNNNFSCQTHYEIIGVKEDANHEEIRKAYRSAILNYHPDKLHKISEKTSNPDHESGSKYLELRKAWNILSDPKSRALYDNELMISRQDLVIAEDVSLEDMAAEDSGSSFELTYQCRCGDYFFIDSAELEEMGYQFSRNGSKISLQTLGDLTVSVMVPCGSCSLKIRLLIDSELVLDTTSNGKFFWSMSSCSR